MPTRACYAAGAALTLSTTHAASSNRTIPRSTARTPVSGVSGTLTPPIAIASATFEPARASATVVASRAATLTTTVASATVAAAPGDTAPGLHQLRRR